MIGLGTAFSYSREIKLTEDQHRLLMRASYLEHIKTLSHSERINASRKGGKNTSTKFESKITKQQIVDLLKAFHDLKRRIPFKQEFFHAKAARTKFGSWSKAIEAAGFVPNPVKFARKYIANDGHKCDSLAEMIIDDWLTVKNIFHEKSVRYPNTKFTADFKVNETYIEFFGLHGQHKTYDHLMNQKLQMVQKKKLKIVAIYPDDLFPRLKLDAILERYNLS